MHQRNFAAAVLCLLLAACGTRSTTSVTPPAGATPMAPVPAAVGKNPSTIPVLETDIKDRKYHALGDISATVSKNTIFDADPTPAKVNEALQRRAAEMGADAVILVRYGTVGIGLFTWGQLEGNGRAIAFDN